jgi:hypothetical protein
LIFRAFLAPRTAPPSPSSTLSWSNSSALNTYLHQVLCRPTMSCKPIRWSLR